MAMAVPLLTPCVLAKLKKPWEEEKFPLKADKHLIRMLQTVKAQFKKTVVKPRGLQESTPGLLLTRMLTAN